MSPKLKSWPSKYRKGYTLTEVFYNNIVSIYNSCLDSEVFSSKFTFKNKKHLAEFSKLTQEDTLDWLLKNKYYEAHFEIVYKQLIRALMYDYLNFMHGVLHHILDKNTSIVFTLLRKPLKETLTLVELMFNEPEKFYIDFVKGNFKEYDPKQLSNDLKLKLIKNTIEKLDIPTFFTPELLYELRFDRHKHYSYDGFWNKAVHLITSAKNIETEKMNLNFIFSEEDDIHEQLAHILQTLSMILYYSGYLFEGIINFFAKSPAEDSYKTRNTYAMILWSYDMHLSNSTRKELLRGFKTIEKDLKGTCPKCNYPIRVNKKFLENYVYNWALICSHCGFHHEIVKTEKIPKHWSKK